MSLLEVQNTGALGAAVNYDLVIEEEADHWLMLEKWESNVAWELHMTTAHVTEANKLAESLLRRPTKHRFLTSLK